MALKLKVSNYHKSYSKNILNYLLSITGLIPLGLLMLLFFPLIKSADGGSLFFVQKRIGKNGKSFNMIKFRTMEPNAEKLRTKYKKLNISDGPTFKIPNDRRYTKFGRILAKSGLDELPQLINVLRGEMSIVGPRPLPVVEADKLTKNQKVRELVLPGITSSWVVSGAHRLKFWQWMRLDSEYVADATIYTDLSIISKTIKIILTIGLRKLFRIPK